MIAVNEHSSTSAEIKAEGEARQTSSSTAETAAAVAPPSPHLIEPLSPQPPPPPKPKPKPRKRIRVYHLQCAECGACFKQISELKKHAIVHQPDLRPFECDKCPNTYRARSSLLLHQQRIHSGEGLRHSVWCAECGNGFYDGKSLRVHRRQHTGEEPYECHLCGRRTKQASNLKSHYLHFHKIADITTKSIRERMRQLAAAQNVVDDPPIINSPSESSIPDPNNVTTNIAEDTPDVPATPLQNVGSIARAQTAWEPAAESPPESTDPNHSQIKSESSYQNFSATEQPHQSGPRIKSEPMEHPESKSQLSLPDDEYHPSVPFKSEPSSEFVFANPYGDDADADEDPPADFDHFDQPVKPDSADSPTDVDDDEMYIIPTPIVSIVEPKPRRRRRNRRSFECFICHQPFADARLIRKHTRTAHKLPPRPRIRTRPSASAIATSRLKRSEVCDLCGLRTVHLSRHRLLHSEERPYACPECPLRFVCAKYLRTHRRSHVTARPFVCDACGAAFKAPMALRKHQRRHTGERPYACKHCPSRFADAATARQHRLLHTGERPYACHLCDRRCTQIGNLRSHLRHFHKIETKGVPFKELGGMVVANCGGGGGGGVAEYVAGWSAEGC